MILADTSIWIEHLYRANPVLQQLLDEKAVLCHPLVIGEVATGSVRDREKVLRALQRLPKAVVARDTEVLRLISEESLFSLGVGYIDLHLVAATRLAEGAKLWTLDKRLIAVAKRLEISFS